MDNPELHPLQNLLWEWLGEDCGVLYRWRTWLYHPDPPEDEEYASIEEALADGWKPLASTVAESRQMILREIQKKTPERIRAVEGPEGMYLVRTVVHPPKPPPPAKPERLMVGDPATEAYFYSLRNPDKFRKAT